MAGVVVVGAGAIGAAVAASLARRGAEVVLVDAGEPGEGTSGATLAWVNAVSREPEAYFALRIAALREHRVLEDALGAAWLAGQGALELAVGDVRAALAERVAWLRHRDYAVEQFPAEAVARVEPSVALDPVSVPWAAHYPDDRWAWPDRLVAACVAAALEAGAEVRAGQPVMDVDVRDGRARGVVLADGERLAGEAVVSCAGPATAELAARMGVTVPLRLRPGLVVATTPVAAELSRLVVTPEVGLRPAADGGVLVSAQLATVDAGDRPDPDDPVCRAALDAARALVPALRQAQVAAARVGVRPVPRDGLPLVGPLPEVDGAYLVVTHSGITLAPLLGRLVAEEILDGYPPAALAPFRPERLVTPARGA